MWKQRVFFSTEGLDFYGNKYVFVSFKYYFLISNSKTEIKKITLNYSNATSNDACEDVCILKIKLQNQFSRRTGGVDVNFKRRVGCPVLYFSHSLKFCSFRGNFPQIILCNILQ